MKGNDCSVAMVVYLLFGMAYIMFGMPILTGMFIDSLVQRPPFMLADGDMVHCIPTQKFLGRMSNPTTRWRTAPLLEPREAESPTLPDLSTFQCVREATQLMAAQAQLCPQGTVPMRSRPQDLTRILGRKAFVKGANLTTIQMLLPDYLRGRNSAPQPAAGLWPDDHQSHKYAVANINGSYRGTQARLNIWNPHVEQKEFSLAQVWVSSTDDNGNLHSLEAGWQIYQELYGDSKPRLFMYWTNDNYSSSGCYNLHCPGFIQVSNKWLLGGSFAEVSTSASAFQYEIKIHIFKDMRTGDWWLQLNNENVGYWPKSLFGPGAFNDSNTRIDWGGEIWHRPGHYTKTQMGSGQHPASSRYRSVAYLRNLQVVNLRNRLCDPPSPTALSSYRGCCHLMVHDRRLNQYRSKRSWGTYAYFGGPGFNPECVRDRSVD